MSEKQTGRRVTALVQVTAPREKFTLPPKRMKSRCSLGWLATEKQWAKVQLCRGCRVCQEVGAVERSGSLGMGYTTGEEVAGSLYQACGLRPMGYPQLPSFLSSLGLITLLEEKAAHRALSFPWYFSLSFLFLRAVCKLTLQGP